MSTFERVVFGEAAYTREAEYIAANRGTTDTTLCRAQGHVRFTLRFIGAHLVKSAYGWTLRYRSGLDNFGLIISTRYRTTDGTREDIAVKAAAWVAEDPDHRYVSVFNSEGW